LNNHQQQTILGSKTSNDEDDEFELQQPITKMCDDPERPVINHDYNHDGDSGDAPTEIQGELSDSELEAWLEDQAIVEALIEAGAIELVD